MDNALPQKFGFNIQTPQLGFEGLSVFRPEELRANFQRLLDAVQQVLLDCTHSLEKLQGPRTGQRHLQGSENLQVERRDYRSLSRAQPLLTSSRIQKID